MVCVSGVCSGVLFKCVLIHICADVSVHANMITLIVFSCLVLFSVPLTPIGSSYTSAALHLPLCVACCTQCAQYCLIFKRLVRGDEQEWLRGCFYGK